MRLNFTPFVDLFSILAIGLLLVMTMTAGTDLEQPEVGSQPVTVIRLYVPEKMAAMAEVQPYFLKGESEVERWEIGANIVVDREERYIQVSVQGEAEADARVGFRVVGVTDPGVIGEELYTTVVRIGESAETRGCRQRVGAWRDPVVCVSDFAPCVRCGE